VDRIFEASRDASDQLLFFGAMDLATSGRVVVGRAAADRLSFDIPGRAIVDFCDHEVSDGYAS
jgi:hypothetical protein